MSSADETLLPRAATKEVNSAVLRTAGDVTLCSDFRHSAIPHSTAGRASHEHTSTAETTSNPHRVSNANPRAVLCGARVINSKRMSTEIRTNITVVATRSTRSDFPYFRSKLSQSLL